MLMSIVRAIRAVATWIVMGCFAFMTLTVVLQVFARYVLNYSFTWTEELATFAQAWVVMIGAGYTMRVGMHVAVDAFVARLPLPVARALSITIAGGCLWFLGIVFYGSLSLLELGWLFETSPVLLIPMWIVYLCMPAGALYFALEILLAVHERWDQPFGLRPEVASESSQ
jgi:TRAP-type C4-dicarboxylate transport system permease small subunit